MILTFIKFDYYTKITAGTTDNYDLVLITHELRKNESKYKFWTHNNTFGFENEDDATLFALKWG